MKQADADHYSLIANKKAERTEKILLNSFHNLFGKKRGEL
uniref:Uncharacterized protein n=1 Tax=Rhizophora mucronata TaxID=61149 RepID=A0A2P2PQI4_RHIMU